MVVNIITVELGTLNIFVVIILWCPTIVRNIWIIGKLAIFSSTPIHFRKLLALLHTRDNQNGSNVL